MITVHEFNNKDVKFGIAFGGGMSGEAGLIN